MNLRFQRAAAAAVAATTLLIPFAAAPAFAQEGRQNDKNTMRNLGVGLGAAALYEGIHGRGTHALVLGAGAAYAGKKYEDQRKAQSSESRRRRYGSYSGGEGYASSYSHSGTRRANAVYRGRSYAGGTYTGPRWRSESATTARRRGAVHSPKRTYLGMGTTTSAEAIDVFVNDRPVRYVGAKPEIARGVVYVPLRGSLEKMGANVRWDERDRAVVAERGRTDIRLPENGPATVNGRRVALSAPPYIENGNTMVPLRFMAETLGARVSWDSGKRDVSIKTPEATKVSARPAASRPRTALAKAG